MKEEKGWNLCLVANATGHVFKSGTDHGHKPYPKKRKKMKTLSNHISLANFFCLFYTNNLLFIIILLINISSLIYIFFPLHKSQLWLSLSIVLCLYFLVLPKLSSSLKSQTQISSNRQQPGSDRTVADRGRSNGFFGGFFIWVSVGFFIWVFSGGFLVDLCSWCCAELQ